jgi:hypothetical protein
VSRIRAVLVGIDEYARSDIPSLRGCVNDVALVRMLLKEHLGVPNEDIRVVVNQRATKENILLRLGATIDSAAPGDVVVFYFSGHGSQIRDRDGDELTDALDELICPYDMDWDRGTYLLDDDLDALFASLPPDILLEAFFDCCFWGAGPRELLPDPRPQSLRTDVRYLPPPFDIAARTEGDEHRIDVHQLVACQFIAEHLGTRDGSAYSRERLLHDLRDYLHSLGYVQTPELAAPTDLRASAPLAPGPGWGTWVEAGGPRTGPERRRRR